MADTEAALVGGLVGGALIIVVIIALIIGLLSIIAMWKIFTKAGEAGWKSIIPIYNIYTYCKIVGLNFWIWILLIPIVIGVITAFINSEDISSSIASIYGLVVEIVFAIRLGKAFDKGTGFKIGLVLLPNIFQLVLAFDSSKYVGIQK